MRPQLEYAANVWDHHFDYHQYNYKWCRGEQHAGPARCNDKTEERNPAALEPGMGDGRGAKNKASVLMM